MTPDGVSSCFDADHIHEMIKNFFYRIVPVLLSAAFLMLPLQGCVKDTSEEEKEILAYDASFKKTIDTRDSLRKQLDEAKTSYLNKIASIDLQINGLKEQKEKAKIYYSTSVEEIKRQVQPVRRRLERELIDFKRQYKIKSEEAANAEDDIREITALTEKKDKLSLTQEEIKTWNDRLAALIEKKEKLSAEKEELAEEIRILKLKLKVYVI